MKFMTTWSLKPAYRKQATARFLETGGRPVTGVKMLGRWHGPAGGFVLAEANEIRALYEWTGQWSDLLDFTVTPVMEDAEAAEVMKKVSG